MKSRTLVIGDIHGGLKALEQVIDRAAVSQDDHLIFLGDYVDGWSQSAQVIEFLIKLEQTHSCIFIKGNHDVWCEDWLNGERPDHTWLFHGGQATVESYQDLTDADRTIHLDFFERMKFYHIDAANRLFLHAGFTSINGVENELYQSDLTLDRSLWEVALKMDKSTKHDSSIYPKRMLLYHEIYIGHTPTLYYDTDVPMHGCNVWNMDTGAAFTGKLSVMDIETKEYWQSDSVASLYPNERGRNRN